ncbi:MAG: putative transposase protein [uncultured bacterium]|jgi:hypothetical protein|nr:MAG: putative transposase protein [uncultured bacterium]
MDKLIINRKEREQLIMLKQVKDGQITQAVAAKRLDMSVRGLRKKQRRYEKEGDAGIVHKNIGKISPWRWSETEKNFTIDLIRSGWRDFGQTFVAEKLSELYRIDKSCEIVRQMMIERLLWMPKKQKIQHRKWRERKEFFGELVQLDGSPHDWFEGRAPKCTLIVFIDDATSQILHLEFVKSESFKGVAGATKNYMSKFGRPLAFYVDFGSVFSVNLNNKDRDKKT